ncbi:MAG: hypothetical protein LC808_08920, partial [Actinobacteria bacterium]|nr:hypothetical protein [Actinomycetota bacterium]
MNTELGGLTAPELLIRQRPSCHSLHRTDQISTRESSRRLKTQRDLSRRNVNAGVIGKLVQSAPKSQD